MLKNFIELNKKLSCNYYDYIDSRFRLPENFGPDSAWQNYDVLLQNLLEELYSKKFDSEPIHILEVGAGRTSSFNQDLKDKYSLKITGLDISHDELKENALNDYNIIFDANNPDYKEKLKNFENMYDLVVSKMFLEHIEKPEAAHKMINFCLKPDGFALHFHPTLYDPSFCINKLLNPKISSRIMKFLSSSRQKTGVFPAYYKNCTAINKNLINFYNNCGYYLFSERHYFGAGYFCYLFPAFVIIFHFLLLCCKFDLRFFSAYSLFCLQKKL